MHTKTEWKDFEFSRILIIICIVKHVYNLMHHSGTYDITLYIMFT